MLGAVESDPGRDQAYVAILEDALKLIGTFATVQTLIQHAFKHHLMGALGETMATLVAKRYGFFSDADLCSIAVVMSRGVEQVISEDEFKHKWHRVKTVRDMIAHTSQIVPLWNPEGEEFVYIGSSSKADGRRVGASELRKLLSECMELWTWVGRITRAQ